MSLLLYWRRPPVDVETQGGVGHPTKGVVASVLFEHDGSRQEEALLVKGTPQYHYLRGVRDSTEREDVREELTGLLAMVDKYSAAEVWTAD